MSISILYNTNHPQYYFRSNNLSLIHLESMDQIIYSILTTNIILILITTLHSQTHSLPYHLAYTNELATQ